ncbi:MAG: chemotaxis protein CheD [Candidatus Omnitrophota bacterium]|jgi:chemotaxis protein CheD|nr:chemotaxis protein CheD [Candidatus Omnitrophota bacterium]
MATIRVGMAQLAIAKSPDRLETQALGSCVGTVLYDSYSKIGGISHAMLPDIAESKTSSRGNLAKFVNTALEQLVDKMIRHGARKKNIKARLVGGVNMFPDIKIYLLHIGKRNTDAARLYLEKADIQIIAEEIGGNFGRTITLDTETGSLHVRTIAHGEKEI